MVLEGHVFSPTQVFKKGCVINLELIVFKKGYNTVYLLYTYLYLIVGGSLVHFVVELENVNVARKFLICFKKRAKGVPKMVVLLRINNKIASSTK